MTDLNIIQLCGVAIVVVAFVCYLIHLTTPKYPTENPIEIGGISATDWVGRMERALANRIQQDEVQALRVQQLQDCLMGSLEWNWLDYDFPLDRWNKSVLLAGHPEKVMDQAEYEELCDERESQDNP